MLQLLTLLCLAIFLVVCLVGGIYVLCANLGMICELYELCFWPDRKEVDLKTHDTEEESEDKQVKQEVDNPGETVKDDGWDVLDSGDQTTEKLVEEGGGYQEGLIVSWGLSSWYVSLTV